MTEEHLLLVIRMLEEAIERPGMYFELEPIAVKHFIHGVRCTCRLFGFQQDHNVREQVLREHGWKYTAMAPWVEMRERRLDAESIAIEVLTIEIKVWKRTYQIS